MIVLLLMLLNWTLEALKWKYLLSSFQHISFHKALKAILGGLTIAVVTPARIGEIGGRILFLKNNRMKGLLTSIIGSISQLCTTIIMGLIAATFFVVYVLKFNSIFLIGIPFLICLILLLFFNLNKFDKILIRFRFTKRLGRIIKVSKFYKILADKKVLSVALTFSFIRYIIFAVQYLLLLKIFGLQIAVPEAIAVIGSIFLLQTIIPTPAIAELGIRNGLAVFLFSFLTNSTESVIAAATSIWIINLLIPATFGSFFVIRQKIVKAKGL